MRTPAEPQARPGRRRSDRRRDRAERLLADVERLDRFLRTEATEWLIEDVERGTILGSLRPPAGGTP